jgi:hypothetical protein
LPCWLGLVLDDIGCCGMQFHLRMQRAFAQTRQRTVLGLAKQCRFRASQDQRGARHQIAPRERPDARRGQAKRSSVGASIAIWTRGCGRRARLVAGPTVAAHNPGFGFPASPYAPRDHTRLPIRSLNASDFGIEDVRRFANRLSVQQGTRSRGTTPTANATNCGSRPTASDAWEGLVPPRSGFPRWRSSRASARLFCRFAPHR